MCGFMIFIYVACSWIVCLAFHTYSYQGGAVEVAVCESGAIDLQRVPKNVLRFESPPRSVAAVCR